MKSTNSSAIELLSKSNPTEGTVISASFQSEGRGQYGRNWKSDSGLNILMSVILYPKFLNIEDQFLLNIVSSLAVRQFVADLTESKVKVKWPNDILVNDQKISGILIQNTLLGKQIKASIVGVGINVNQDEFNIEGRKAISLKMLLNSHFDLLDLFPKVFSNLEKYYLRLKKGDFEQLLKEYNDHLFQKNEFSQIQLDSKPKKCLILEVQRDGRILVEMDSERRKFNFGDIKFI